MLSILKRLWTPSQAPTSVLLTVTSGAEHQPTTGLIPLAVDAAVGAPMEATLVLFAESQAAPLYAQSHALVEGVQSWRLAIHGQLLPNGPQNLRLALQAPSGKVLAEQRLTVIVANEGPIAAAVADSLRRTGAPAVVEGVCDSGAYDYTDPSLFAWFDRPEPEALAHIAALLASGAADDEEAEALRHFVRFGFLALPDVISPEHLGRLNAALDDAVEKGVEGYAWGSSQRMHGLHDHYPAIRELWLHPRVLKMLDLIFGARARPSQSLTYVFGSQQEHHQDTIHLTPFPAGYMCGVWTALEDVQPESGELAVFPGSHRLPRVYLRTANVPKVTNDDWTQFGQVVVPVWTDLINQNGFAPEPYRPKAGSVLIWHENLMHMGSVRRDLEKSRRSVVCHYFAEGAVAYYDSSGMPGHVYMGPRA